MHAHTCMERGHNLTSRRMMSFILDILNLQFLTSGSSRSQWPSLWRRKPRLSVPAPTLGPVPGKAWRRVWQRETRTSDSEEGGRHFVQKPFRHPPWSADDLLLPLPPQQLQSVQDRVATLMYSTGWPGMISSAAGIANLWWTVTSQCSTLCNPSVCRLQY